MIEAIRHRGMVLAVAAGMYAAAGTVAHATIPDASGAFHACYAKNGQLRVIDNATEQCKANETPVAWNQTGQQGPKGDQGPQGPEGEQGPPGEDGVTGYSVVHVQEIVEARDEPPLNTRVTALCPDGTRVVGGGYSLGQEDHGVNEFKSSNPVFNPDGWMVFLGHDEDFDVPVDVWAICIIATP